jgi:hypothetical protein
MVTDRDVGHQYAKRPAQRPVQQLERFWDRLGPNTAICAQKQLGLATGVAWGQAGAIAVEFWSLVGQEIGPPHAYMAPISESSCPSWNELLDSMQHPGGAARGWSSGGEEGRKKERG